MKIAIIGNGNVGSALARRLTATGHEVTVANSATPPSQVAAQAAAADAVVLAVRFGVIAQLHDQVKAALNGKVVIDVTNPQTPDFMALTIGHTTSAGEQVATTLPGARVVKAFNTIFAANIEAPDLGGSPQFLPVAGDDDTAKQTVIDLSIQLGFDAVDAGPLANARYLEPAVELLVHLAFASGLGTGIGYTLARA
ncbi:NADPH-dependent F420 reductase [Nonomuraea turcica]|uniref:NADPH-dependent F420 reductase n=1 Tax=Nonomuraea sp. G32 TaxID=3067274 RepID=UPI00273B4D7F|nr:NAD(P)-binding domain-containing protein [Nonomuraea sp. G32]MDP4511779.1 NAD(P)-binding domain-containing protein [Nonomuraea sp. G32]